MHIQVAEAQSSAQRESVYRFRYTVYGQELDKDLAGMDHDNSLYTDGLDEDARILVATDARTGEIVGTLRNNRGTDRSFSGHHLEHLNMAPLADSLGPAQVGYSSAFMVAPAYRGRTVASLLFSDMFRYLTRQHRAADFCVSELALVGLYVQLGFQTYMPPCRLSDHPGLRQPLVLPLTDVQHFVTVGSPFRNLVNQSMDDGGATAVACRKVYPDFSESQFSPLHRRALWAALAHAGSASAASLFEGFGEKHVASLLEAFPSVKLKAGEQLYRQGEREAGMALIVSGSVGVTLSNDPNPHYVAVLSAQEMCGEMASLLGTTRSASLHALEDTEVLLLPHNLLDKLAQKDMESAFRLSSNLNRVLARRLQAMNSHVVALHNAGETKGAPTAGGQQAAPVASESYSFATLDDPEEELRRLESQAEAGWGVEHYWLQHAGFEDKATFLDLGSGPGVTSRLLARTFRGARVIGVEPDGALRTRATTRAAELGFASSCTFVEGTGESIPLADDSVDFAYLRFLVQHLPDPVAVLTELRRVLRPGGVVVVADVDDAGIIVHPEPAGLPDFQSRTLSAQQSWGGDRNVGRKLPEYMLKAGFKNPRLEVAPVTSHLLPGKLLVDLAFSFKAQTLKRTGMFTAADETVLQELDRLCQSPDGFVLVPVFFGRGTA